MTNNDSFDVQKDLHSTLYGEEISNTSIMTALLRIIYHAVTAMVMLAILLSMCVIPVQWIALVNTRGITLVCAISFALCAFALPFAVIRTARTTAVRRSLLSRYISIVDSPIGTRIVDSRREHAIELATCDWCTAKARNTYDGLGVSADVVIRIVDQNGRDVICGLSDSRRNDVIGILDAGGVSKSPQPPSLWLMFALAVFCIAIGKVCALWIVQVVRLDPFVADSVFTVLVVTGGSVVVSRQFNVLRSSSHSGEATT